MKCIRAVTSAAEQDGCCVNNIDGRKNIMSIMQKLLFMEFVPFLGHFFCELVTLATKKKSKNYKVELERCDRDCSGDIFYKGKTC